MLATSIWWQICVRSSKKVNPEMCVAVDVGKLPWTPEADWGTTKFKADICGPKNWNSAENTPVLCSGVSRGNITISEEGMYDIYFIKYDGKSEFGVDKGYGKDFFKLKQKLCTFVNTTKCDSINNQSDQNRAAQLAQIQQLSAQSAKDLESAKSAAKEIADQKLAAFVAKNKARIIPFKFKLFGFGSEYIGKDEKAAIETGPFVHSQTFDREYDVLQFTKSLSFCSCS